MSGKIDVFAALDAELAAFRESKKAKADMGEQTESMGSRFPHGSPAGSPCGSPSFSNNINELEVGGTGGTEIHKTRDHTRDKSDNADTPKSHVIDLYPCVHRLKTVPPVPPNRNHQSDQSLDRGTDRGTRRGTGRLGEPGFLFPEAASLVGSSPLDLQDWRAWMGERYRSKMASGHFSSRDAAMVSVWEEALRAWHMINGKVPDRDGCGACGEVLEMWDSAITVIDGARVHASQDCLYDYGERCRAAAHEALVAIGLKPPPTE
jgi:hypothetical protein